MAAIATQLVSTPQWNAPNVVYGVFDGFSAVRLWEGLINYNNSDSPEPLSWTVNLSVMMSIISTYDRVANVFSPNFDVNEIQDNFFERNLAIITVGGLALMAVNATAMYRGLTRTNLDDAKSSMDQFLVVVWKSTPYLMLITNIVLIVIDLRYNTVVAAVSLAAVGISLIALTPWKPENFDWDLDINIRIPIDVAMMYYYEDVRGPILVSLAIDLYSRGVFGYFFKRWN
jgi:hypothetical protein